MSKQYESLVQELAHKLMLYSGYSEDVILAAEAAPEHTEKCRADRYGWDCFTTEGKSNHPVKDRLMDYIDIISDVIYELDKRELLKEDK